MGRNCGGNIVSTEVREKSEKIVDPDGWSGEVDLIWDDEYDADNIQKAQKDPKLTVHTYVGSGASVDAIDKALVPPHLLLRLEWGEKGTPHLLQGALPGPTL